MKTIENIDLSAYTLVNPDSIKKKKCKREEFIDIEVEDDHTFFVITENEERILSSNSDGNHIRTLLLTFFFNHMRELIKAGHVYKGRPPLYKILHGRGKKNKTYAFSDKERDTILSELRAANPEQATEVQRRKGLGEMSVDEMFETTMDPTQRTLYRICLSNENEQEAERMFSILMGTDIQSRKKFIEDNALNVKNLDV